MNESATPQHHVVCFYKFERQDPQTVQSRAAYLKKKGEELDLRGLVLVGEEGFNQTVCGTENAVKSYQRIFTDEWKFKDIHFKYSLANRPAFPRFKVKIKEEIVTLGRPDLAPETPQNFHLSPEAYREAMKEEGVVLIDTRNDYETRIGKFKNAIDPKIQSFQEFPKFVRESGIPKDKKVLIYCTGGIRCEKAILEMHEQGYENVYQLNGGILNYFEEVGGDLWEGECFLFDHRVAVTPDLKPSQKYGLCPHCGDPSEVIVHCTRCAKDRRICIECSEQGITTCSKRCENEKRYLALRSSVTK